MSFVDFNFNFKRYSCVHFYIVEATAEEKEKNALVKQAPLITEKKVEKKEEKK